MGKKSKQKNRQIRQTSLNDLVFDEEVSKFKSLKLRQIVATNPL